MREAAQAMYLPQDSELGISAQDDSFLRKKRLELSAIPKESFPLLLHYHPLFLYRHQVCKQADTILAHLLFPHTADEDTMARSYDYYASVTTRDSSLSLCAFAMMAAKLGRTDEALKHFRDTVGLDLNDAHGNTRDGIHTAGMGGAYLTAVAGFGGVAMENGMLCFQPHWPSERQSLSFPLCYQGRRLRCYMDAWSVSIDLVSGEPLTVRLDGRDVTLTDSPI